MAGFYLLNYNALQHHRNEKYVNNFVFVLKI